MVAPVLKMSVSLDGYVASADGNGDRAAAWTVETLGNAGTAPLALEPTGTTAFSRGVVAHVFTAHR
jgi:hypothetical protein